MKPIFLLLLLPPLLGAAPAFAGGYNLPDPPHTLDFDRVNLRVVAAPNGKVPASCNAKYRAGMEGAFRRIWGQCQALGNEEPSECQRALFDRCTRVAQELQAMETAACTEMLAASEALDRIRNPDKQSSSQLSSADLNQRAASATRKVAATLSRQAAELAERQQAARDTLGAAACAASTSQAAYEKTSRVLLGELAEAQGQVAAEARARTAAAAELEKNAGTAGANAAALQSAAPPPGPGTISTGTAAFTEVKATPPAPLPVVSGSDEKKIDWVPILAVGIPAAAILGALVYSSAKSKKGDPAPPGGGEQNPGPGAGPAPGPQEPAPEPAAPQAPPERASGQNGPAQEAAGPAPGDADVRSLEITLDASFTDRQKATIASAVLRVPACHRGKLRRLQVVSANLNQGGRGGGGGCVAGMFRLGGYRVWLDPRCAGIQVGITLHEFFHVIGNRNGNALHQSYLRQVYQPNGRCPVSRYGATHWMEDFAEAGRILHSPQAGQRSAGACVQRKLEGLQSVLASCQ